MVVHLGAIDWLIMAVYLVFVLGITMAGARQKALSGFEEEASRYHKGVYKRKQLELQSSIDGRLKTLFLGQLSAAHKSGVREFSEAVSSAVKAGQKKGGSYDFYKIVQTEKSKALKRFEACFPATLAGFDAMCSGPTSIIHANANHENIIKTAELATKYGPSSSLPTVFYLLSKVDIATLLKAVQDDELSLGTVERCLAGRRRFQVVNQTHLKEIIQMERTPFCQCQVTATARRYGAPIGCSHTSILFVLFKHDEFGPDKNDWFLDGHQQFQKYVGTSPLCKMCQEHILSGYSKKRERVWESLVSSFCPEGVPVPESLVAGVFSFF